MASRVGLGVPIPTLLPITGSFALPFISYFLLLSNRIVQTRVATHAYIGDTLTPDQLSKVSNSDSKTTAIKRQNSDPLTLNSRAFNNFLENVPLAFILLATAELNGGDRKVLTGLMSTLFVLRIAHVEYGIYGPDNAAWGRPIGYFGSCGILAGLAGYSAWLSKGYWGF